MSTVNKGPVHPLSPRQRLPRAVLIILLLSVLWTIDPQYVDTVSMWLGILVVLLPAPSPVACTHHQRPALAAG
ncbi:hypothetical protein [Streptomyces sp. NPDC001717]|uniref:hypothetical protein n=1 Tax=Streptomyces sp. NPDC001717 TaxID=3364604 RepID=UPI0036A68555